MPTHDRATSISPALQRLIADDAIGQLRRQDGRMALLGSENGALKLDWVEEVARLLDDNTGLEMVETEARDIWAHGIHHVIWAGMGGSVLTVRVLTDLGFCRPQYEQGITIYPLDSTDPAALNEIVRQIARAKQVALPTPNSVTTAFLRTFLQDVMMIGVSMGMTSEEPITHLTWFSDLLMQAQLVLAEHLLVMTLPGSYLDQFAQEHQVPSHPLQLDGRTGTGGRMSAPTTRVFLLPAALAFAHMPGQIGMLREALRRAWSAYDLTLATERPADHPFVRLAAALSNASANGACRLLLNMPEGWQVLTQWIEQLMEESLGKGGKGIVVFDDQPLNTQASGYRADGLLRVRVVTSDVPANEGAAYTLSQPYLASKGPLDRLVALVTSFLGWQLTMALYGYLHQISFAGQPAVENYKARARTLRTQRDPLEAIQHWSATFLQNSFTLLGPQQSSDAPGTPSEAFALALREAPKTLDAQMRLGYLDLTFNGELLHDTWSYIHAYLRHLGNTLLGVPVKLRRAPAAYHSTEQSEMDGPSYLVSLRILLHRHEDSILGTYTDTFLLAQAVSTWQAMLEQERTCFLLLIDEPLDKAREPLHSFFQHVEQLLHTT